MLFRLLDEVLCKLFILKVYFLFLDNEVGCKNDDCIIKLWVEFLFIKLE